MYKHLNSEQRYTISILLQNGMKRKDIASAIGVSPSTITRELQRNSGKRGKYNWETAQSNATYHKRRKPGNRTVSTGIREEAIRLLASFQWSPEQISGSLKYRDMNISHETIYAIIRKDKREGGSLCMHCRHALKHHRRIIAGRCASIPNRTSISLRPAEADGTMFGDFEMDTIVGKGNHGAIVTIVERSTNMFFMRKLNKGKNAQALAQTVVRMLMPYKVFIGNDFPFSEFLIPVVKGPTGEWHKAFFPYDVKGNPIPKDRIFANDGVSRYLEGKKKELLKESSEEENPNWHLYGRTQAIKDVWKDKISVNTIVKDTNSIKLHFVPMGGGVYSGLYILTSLSMVVICASLVSDGFVQFVTSLKKYKSGGYYTFNSGELEQYLNYEISKLVEKGIFMARPIDE